MNPKDWLLRIAQEVEDNPDHWTKHVMARDGDGGETEDIQRAVCWCAVGFLHRDACYLSPANDDIVRSKLCNTAATSPISVANDLLVTPAEFVAWFRSAAEVCP